MKIKKQYQLNCQYCDNPTKLVDSSLVYGHSYGIIYYCQPCHAWVGVHQGTTKPKGKVATQQLRNLRKQAHYYFDFLWQEKARREQKINPQYKKNEARKAAYIWLSEQLNLKRKKCHIAMFNEKKCLKTIEICKPYVLRIKQKNIN